MNEESIKQFISNFNTSIEKFTAGKSNEHTLILFEVLNKFLDSLTKPEIKTFSKNIVNKYTENHQKIKQKYLKAIINITHIKTVRRLFIKWKHRTNQTHSKQEQTQSIGSNYHIHKLNKSSNESFINRQEMYTRKQKEKKNKISSQTEEDLIAQCTFSPKVFSTKDQMSPGVRNKKAVDRLLADSNRRNEIYFKKQYESNSKAKVNSLGNNNTTNNKAINKLYQDAKEREVSMKTLQQQIDEERGITFKPVSFTKDSGYEVSTQFHERNKKLVDDRHNFVFVYDYLRQSKFNDNALYKKNQLIPKAIEINNEKEPDKEIKQ